MANTNGVEDNMRRYGTKGYLMRVAVVSTSWCLL